jgi:hypothetical protein
VSADGGRGVDAWDQHAWAWDAAFYGVLGLATVVALLEGGPGDRDRWVVLGLAAVTAGWHLAFQRTGVDEQRPGRALLYLGGLVVLWFLLAGTHPVYFSALLVIYPQSSASCACPWPSRPRSR